MAALALIIVYSIYVGQLMWASAALLIIRNHYYQRSVAYVRSVPHKSPYHTLLEIASNSHKVNMELTANSFLIFDIGLGVMH